MHILASEVFQRTAIYRLDVLEMRLRRRAEPHRTSNGPGAQRQDRQPSGRFSPGRGLGGIEPGAMIRLA